MSKLGKKPISIPKDTKIKIESGKLTLTGPKGSKQLSLNDKIFTATVADENLILNTSHIDLARKVAEESMVLIKNEDVLPFKISENIKVGVIGNIANLENTGDMGSSNSSSPYVITPYQGIKNFTRK